MSSLEPDEKVCPYCAEVIKAAAVKCRYCQSELTVGPGGKAEKVPLAATPGRKAEARPLVADGDGPPTHTRIMKRSERPRQDQQPGRVSTVLASAQLLVALVILCLVLAAVGGFAWYRSEHPDEGAAPNGAITSTDARNAGLTAAATLTSKVLSYDWETMDAESKANQAVLAPSFRTEYAKTMAGVKAGAIKNQVKLKATAAATSIVSATETKVVALVFVNQVTTAKGTTNQRVDSSRVLVTLTRSGGDWRISKLKAF
jgi:hypothetical protein